MEDDVPLEAEELPGGFTPLWLDVPEDTTHLEILTRLSQLTEIANKSVTVLYESPLARERAAADFSCCCKINLNEVIVALQPAAGDTISN